MAGSENSTSLPVSRRAILGGATAVVAVAQFDAAVQVFEGHSQPAALPPADAAPVRRGNPVMDELCQRWQAFVRWYQDLEDSNHEDPAAWERLDWEYDALMRTIAATPVRTVGDVTFKLEAALHNAGTEINTDTMRGILADLRTLTA